MRLPAFTRLLLCTLLALLLFAPLAGGVRAQAPIITMTVAAGFDGRFRELDWLPVFVTLRNDGDPVSGRLVVRPETSGSAILNTYSAPVELPAGASQRVALYVTARAFATQIVVELIDSDGIRIADAAASIGAMQPADRLYAVVTTSAAGSVDLTGAHFEANAAYQTNWRISDVPDRVAALAPVDLLLFSDVDTASLSSAQRAAIAAWVRGGGHLVVTGGAAWQATAAGLAELLPVQPNAQRPIASLEALGAWLGTDDADRLAVETVGALGDVRPDAQVLVAADDVPLLLRHPLGGGVVDYLTVDPNAAPLRGWSGLTTLWLTLTTTAGAQPSWGYGVLNWDPAATAVEILPGFDILPDVLPLCGFLAAYIALVGPVNYVILARLNRRELAWLTIPALILIFSVLAYNVGFNLRGTEATLSRLSFVQSWGDDQPAHADTLIGLLSPRRAQYSLAIPPGGMLRPIPRFTAQGGGLVNAAQQSRVEIVETDMFRAASFLVDASFIAGFHASLTVDAPAIGGEASLVYVGADGEQRVRGAVRNDGDVALENAVILARGAAYRLNVPLAPGALETFEFTLPGENAPSPAPYAPVNQASVFSPYYSGGWGYYNLPSSPTLTDVFQSEPSYSFDTVDAVVQADRRRRLFLSAFINDFYTAYSTGGATSYNVGTGRGDEVYLVGFTRSVPFALTLEGASWNADDETLLVVALDTQIERPPAQVTIAADRFTWAVDENTTLGAISPLGFTLQLSQAAAFRFTPLPAAVLRDVNRLTLRAQSPSIGSSALAVELWNWGAQRWETVQIRNGSESVNRPARFLGPNNAVRVRFSSQNAGGYLQINAFEVEQRGTY